MLPISSTTIVAVAAPMLALSLCAVAYSSGHKSGKAAAEAAHAAQTIEQQSATIAAWQAAAAEHAALIEASQSASAQVRAAVEAMTQTNRKTTHELQTLLAATAADRAGCLLDAGIVRQLSTAHDWATGAAAGTASGGADERLPATPRAARKPK